MGYLFATSPADDGPLHEERSSWEAVTIDIKLWFFRQLTRIGRCQKERPLGRPTMRPLITSANVWNVQVPARNVTDHCPSTGSVSDMTSVAT